ncbi:hypothetical protein Pla22_32980 [Rubripirellula amarantea]|uniref:Dockerin type I repeat protein n=2 Tax=Rubripirellula amarantea TaxID=2527999 RepID=A0A5C5WKC5_9BACT|nr:hypothetical protein Pla22_32980 [Rubripirellula amarantea]
MLSLETLEQRRLLTATLVQETPYNDSRAQAQDIGIVGEQIIEGNLGYFAGDPDDTRYIDPDNFSFDVESAQHVAFRLQQFAVFDDHQIVVLLYDSDSSSSALETIYNDRESTELVHNFGLLEPGTYFVTLLPAHIADHGYTEIRMVDYQFSVELGDDTGSGSGGNNGGGTGTGTGEPVENDSIEPNDTLGTASRISSVIPRVLAVDAVIAQGDVDYFSFDNEVPGDLVIDIDARDGERSELNSAIELYRLATGELLASNLDGVDPDTGDDSGDSLLRYRDRVGGAVAVRVSGEDDSVGAYRLSFTSSPRIPFGAYEFNDTFETATPVSILPNVPLEIRGAEVRPDDDLDHYQFELTSRGWLTLDIDAQEIGMSTLDGRLTLMNASADVLEVSESGVDPDTEYRGLDPVIRRLLEPGTYVVRVDGSTTEVDNFYVLTALFEKADGLTSDSIGDTFTAAANMGLLVPYETSQRNSAIDDINDIDMFRLDFSDMERPTLLKVDIDASPYGSSLDSYVRLFDSDGNELASNDDAFDPVTGNSSDSWLERVLVTPGIYYVGVSSFGNQNYVSSGASVTAADGGTTTGEYIVRFDTKVSTNARSNRIQTVYLDFEGGRFTDHNQYSFHLPAFDPADVGRPASERDAIIERVYEHVLDDFIVSGSFEDPDTPLNLPIDFVLERPSDDLEYSTIMIGGSYPLQRVLGLAQKVDIGNRDIEDNAAVFTQAFRTEPTVYGKDLDTVSLAIASTLSHEVGHLLGLSHQVEDGLLMQTGKLDTDRSDDERFGRGQLFLGLKLPPGEFEDSVERLRQALQIPPAFVGPDPGDPSFTGVGQVSTFIYQAFGGAEVAEINVEAGENEVLFIDVDAQSLGSKLDLQMEVYDQSGALKSTVYDSIDPITNAVSLDPHLRYQVPSAGIYTIRLKGSERSSDQFNSAQTVSVNVRRSTEEIEQRLIVSSINIGRVPKSISVDENELTEIIDDSGNRIVVEISGGGTLDVETSSATANQGDIERIVVRDATNQTRVSVRASQQGARIGEILFNSETAVGLQVGTESIPVDVNDVISVASLGQVDLHGKLHGRISVGGSLQSLRINSTAENAVIQVADSLDEATFESSTAAAMSIGQRLTQMTIHGSWNGRLSAASLGDIDVLGDFGSANLPDSSTEEVGALDSDDVAATQASIVADHDIESVNVLGSFYGAIRSGGSVEQIASQGLSMGTIVASTVQASRFTAGTMLLQTSGTGEMDVVLHQVGSALDGVFATGQESFLDLRLADSTGQIVRDSQSGSLDFDGQPAGFYRLIWDAGSMDQSVAIRLPTGTNGLQLDAEQVDVAILDLDDGQITVPASSQYRTLVFSIGQESDLSLTTSGLSPTSLAMPRIISSDREILGSLVDPSHETSLQTISLSPQTYVLLVPPLDHEITVELDFEHVGSRTEALTNVLYPSDVNLDGQTSALDALLIVNLLARVEGNLRTAGLLPDVSGDGDVTALDALQVINRMTRTSLSASSDGEMVSFVKVIRSDDTVMPIETPVDSLDRSIEEMRSWFGPLLATLPAPLRSQPESHRGSLYVEPQKGERSDIKRSSNPNASVADHELGSIISTDMR